MEQPQILQRSPDDPGKHSYKKKDSPYKAIAAILILVIVVAAAYAGYRIYTSTTAETGKSSGLNWPSGAYNSGQLQPALDFQNWRGRPLDATLTFTSRGSWSNLISAEPYTTRFKPFYQDKNKIYVISQPFYPTSGGNNAACASGAYNNYWRQFGQMLSSKGLNHRSTVIRIAWEFNGDFMYYRPAVPLNPTQQSIKAPIEEWKKCWRNVAQSVKATAPSIRAEWPLNSRGSLAYPLSRTGSRLVYDAYLAYPGDDVVDIVGTNDYDHHPPATNETDWNNRCNAEYGSGACNVARFARQHKKQIAVSEWGIKSCTSSNSMGGDNPLHIRKMAQFFNANRDIMAYEIYYDDIANGNVCSSLYRKNGNGVTNSKSSAEYLKWFGKNSPYVNGGGGAVNPNYPAGGGSNPNPTPTTPPTAQPQSFNNKILVAPDKKAYYVRDSKATHIGNPAIMYCISVRRGAGNHINVAQSVINGYAKGSEGYCNYQQEPGLNFVREDGDPAVWLVRADGTKLHVGILCVPDAYTTPLKKFRVFVVPRGETAGHRDVGDFFGTPGLCGTLPVDK